MDEPLRRQPAEHTARAIRWHTGGCGRFVTRRAFRVVTHPLKEAALRFPSALVVTTFGAHGIT
jgi:hypothetical protein